MEQEASKDVARQQRGSMSVAPRLENELERFFDRRWPGLSQWPRLSQFRDVPVPNVDMVDQESDILIKAEMPGYSKDEIDVSVTDSTMTIKATNNRETETQEDGDYYLNEISRSYVSRTLQLPAEVDGQSAKATYADGILRVVVPKVAKAKRQRIEIQS